MQGELPYNSDCIIYNDHGEGNDRIAVKHVLNKVWWVETTGVNAINKGVEADNNVTVLMTKRDGYLAPDEWQALTKEAAMSGKYYTLQYEDRMIKGTPEAPDTFTSTVQVTKHLGHSQTRQIMRVKAAVMPGGVFHHFRIGCR